MNRDDRRMGKLAERLGDERRSGVYRVEVTDALEEAAGIVGLPIVSACLNAASAGHLLADCVRATALQPAPDWAAFAAALADPSWTPAPGRILLIEGFEPLLEADLRILAPLIAALESAAAGHRLRGERFFAVFLDPGRRLALDPLYDRRRLSALAPACHAIQDNGGEP